MSFSVPGAARALTLSLALGLCSAQAAKADAAAGEVLFKRHCAVCHSTKAGEILSAPSLARLVGRKSGATPGFPYSAAMKSAGVVWSPASLDAFIAAPRKTVPKTNMAFTGLPDAAKRADLIAYLATLK